MLKIKSAVRAILCVVMATIALSCVFACSGNGDDNTVTISVSATSISLKVGESYELNKLNAKASDNSAVSYTVEGEGVIAINGNKLVALSVGTDNLVISAGEVSKKISVTVAEAPKSDVIITVNGVQTTYKTGDTVAQPETPTKDPTVEKEYVFAGWYIAGTDELFDFIAKESVELEARFTEQARRYDVTFGTEVVKVAYGSLATKPQDPTKEPTQTVAYVFDGWYNGDVAWDFENDVVTGNVTLTARFTETTRMYTVVMGDEEAYCEYGALVAKPQDPVKEPTDTEIFEFIGWYNGDVAWDFENDVVTQDITLTAKYNAIRAYVCTVSIIPERFSMTGVAAYSLFDLDEEDYANMSAEVVDADGKVIPADVKEGKCVLHLQPGNYTFKLTYYGKVVEKSVRVLSGNSSTSIEIKQNVDLGGKMVGEVDGTTYEYPSYGKGSYTIDGNNITVKGLSYAYIGGEALSSKYYLEADVKLNTVGKMVGFMAASEFKNLSNDEDKKLQGENDKMGKKLIFSFSGSNTIYYQNEANWSTGGITDFCKVSVDTANVEEEVKIGMVRSGNEYFIFLNDVLMTRYTTDDYGDSAFGFASTASAGEASFKNVKYTVKEQIVDAILEEYDTGAYLGGSFTAVNGTTYKSYGSYTLTSHNSGVITGAPGYLYANDTVGSVYYQEVTFDKYINDYWIGLISNTSDGGLKYGGSTSTKTVWYSYGLGYGQLFRHEKDAWYNGTSVMSGMTTYVTAGSSYTLAIARVNDQYFIFIDGELIYTDKISVASTTGSGVVDADNLSGMGIFRGANGSATTVFSNYWCTTDESEVINKIAEFCGANVTYGENVTVTQFGKNIKSGNDVVAGFPVSIAIDVPEGKNVGSLVVKQNGIQIGVGYSDGAFVFTPVNGAEYDITATIMDSGEANTVINIVPVTNKVGEEKFKLYDLTIDPADVKISIFNFNTGLETSTTASSLKLEEKRTAGYYKISVTYKNNVYEKFVTIENGVDLELDMFVSPVYLGGAITIPNENGVDTTYYSFDDVTDITATKGGGWSLVDGKRDTVTVTNHAYVFQNEQSGTKYYVEGTFDSNQQATFFSGVGGLLVSHGPKKLEGGSDKKLIAGIYGKSVVLVVAPGWGAGDSRLIANYADVLGEYDASNVKLGVVRDGTDYWFFVNDQYVGFYNYEDITTESGFGVACVPVIVTIRNFNYSFNDDYIDALKEIAPKQTEKEIDIYIIAGQSNASGYTAASEITAMEYDERLIYGTNNVWYAGDAESTSGSTTAHRKLGWGLARLGQGASATKIGPEAGMMLTLSDYYNEESGKIAGMIKFAHGGTALLDSIGGENAAGGNWVPPSYEATITPKSPGNLTGGLYRTLLAQTTQNVNELKAMGFTKINIKGMFWMQGESDKSNPSEYKKAFKYFASDIRKDLGEIVGEDLSNMPIIVGEISRTSGSAASGTVTTNNNFIAMQNTLPDEVNDVYVVASGQFDINKWENGANKAVGTDSWHWNQADMLTIGEMVGECIVNILEE